MATARTLDTNVLDAASSALSLTTEVTVSMYICKKTGSVGDFRVTLEVSPDDGTTWIPKGDTLSKDGVTTIACVATQVRAKVLVAQGVTSTVDVFLLAR